MKILNFYKTFAAVLVLFVCLPVFSAGKDKIVVTADMLTADRNGKYAEFSGKVEAVQEKTKINSDKLKIYYHENTGGSKKREARINRIIAEGNVVIKFDDKTAFTQKAVYSVEKGILLLTGTGSKIINNNNSISGSNIKVYRYNNKITIQGDKTQRVTGIFYSKGRGINLK